jgi:membrane protein DedA with SNARE-associated domain
MEAINDLVLQAVGSPWLYPTMFAVAVIDGVFPPVPSESVLVAAASAAVTGGRTELWLLGLSAAAGAIVGDNLAYAIGRWIGTERFAWMRRPRVASVLDRAGGSVARHGASLILVARYVPGGRVAVNMSAGALGYPRRRFFVLTVVAGLSWGAYGLVVGTTAGHWFEGHPVLAALVGIVVAVATGLVLDRVVTHVRERRTTLVPTVTAEAGHRDSSAEGRGRQGGLSG